MVFLFLVPAPLSFFPLLNLHFPVNFLDEFLFYCFETNLILKELTQCLVMDLQDHKTSA